MFILRKLEVAIFADIIKIVIISIKTIFKYSKKFKQLEIVYQNVYLYLYLLMQQNLLISGEKMQRG